MAASLRSSILRQALAAPSQRTMASSVLPTFRASQMLRPSNMLQRATFQTTAARAILPPLPQVMKGGVNEAAAVPDPEPTHGSYHWTFERAMSIALIPITAIPFAAGSVSPLIDSALIGGLILHSYIGFQSVITDYFPKWRVPIWRKVLDWANFFGIFIVGWGFYEFETNDVGLTEGVKKIWRA